MKHCGFAFPGTWGHECGRPAIVYAVKPSKLTHSGLYYGGRCEECAKINGGENSEVIRFEPISNQVNNWR